MRSDVQRGYATRYSITIRRILLYGYAGMRSDALRGYASIRSDVRLYANMRVCDQTFYADMRVYDQTFVRVYAITIRRFTRIFDQMFACDFFFFLSSSVRAGIEPGRPRISGFISE